MRAEIISVGTELLLGDIVNTNAQFLAQELAALGFAVYHQTVVGDNPARLRALVLEAKERSDLLVFTGGLGPTDDDLTKETVAEAFGDTLVLDPDELVKLESFFIRLGREMAPNNRKQAMVPRRGKKLENPNGTAPGVMFRQGGKYAVLLPGPPREMRPMFENEVRPLLEEMQDGAIRSRSLHIIGMGESDLEVALYELTGGQNPTVALYAKEGEVHVRVTARAATTEQADHICAEMVKQIEQTLGDIVYSTDGSELPEAVVRLLAARGETVALAESCTGGLLAQRITSVPGASAVFGYGAVSYANEFKRRMLGVRAGTLRRYGAVSGQVCAEMAFGAAKKGRAEYGVGITGVAGPGGGSEEKPVGLVYVGVARAGRVFIRKLNVAGRARDYVRTIATQNALDMLRRVALNLPVPGAKEFTKGQIADFERAGRPRRRGGRIWQAVAAVLLVAALFAGLMLGLYYLRQGETAMKSVMPSARGLKYGTAEYSRAAQELVQSEKETNPAVAGFVALPGGLVEGFVAGSQSPQESLAEVLSRAGGGGMALQGKNAAYTVRGGNMLVVGGGVLRPMLELADTARAGEVSSFSYFTAGETREYRVFAAAYLDEGQPQPDGFNPAQPRLENYADYLDFLLGARGRSLYVIPLDVAETDSFMTLQTEDPARPGRWFTLFGRLARPGEKAEGVKAVPAGAPLMPNAFYEQQGLPTPDFDAYYGRWLRRYLAGDVNNMDLQLQAGMPAEDRAPSIVVYPEETETAPAADETAGGETAETAASSSSEGETPVTVERALVLSAQKASVAQTGEAASNAQPAAESGAAEAQVAPAAEQPAPQSVSQSQPPQPAILRPDPRFLTVRMNGVLVRDTCANVLAAVCQSEMPAAPPEAVKAQAVAVHSWILCQQGGGNPAPAVRGEAPGAEMKSLAEEVETLVLSADGYNPAFTPWFGMAALGTNPSSGLWGVSRSYLEGVPTPEEARHEGWQQIVPVPRGEMEALLAENLGLAPGEMGEPQEWLAEIEQNESGYVESLTIGGQKLNGLFFWRQFLLRDGMPLLPSPAFSLEYSGEEFLFTVQGRGHGCGLSQTGAIQMAGDNADYEKILACYFPGTRLMEWV